MAAKAILGLFQALLTQSVLSQCAGPIGAGLAPASDWLAGGAGCSPFTPIASGGGSFVVTSASPIAPTGVTVVSENLYEGALIVGGNLPLLGSVGLEGEFPTAGTGAVSYGCGDGVIGVVTEVGPIMTGILAEDFPTVAGIGIFAPEIAPGYALSAGYGPAAPFGYGYGLGYGLGYRMGYGGYGLGYGGGRGCGVFF